MAEQHSAHPGESWAYRARSVDDLVEVVEVIVVRLGTQRPARVQVRFVEDRFEGRQAWVPPSRLKVRWEAVDEFRERERLWERVFSLGVDEDSPLDMAAWQVFEDLIEPEIAIMLFRRAGACCVNDSDRLSEIHQRFVQKQRVLSDMIGPHVDAVGRANLDLQPRIAFGANIFIVLVDQILGE